MAKYLVIVESPAKVKTIKKFLGANYEVDASNGHVRDLPKSQLGVDIENNYEPKYITIRGKGDVLAKLRKEVKKAEKIYPVSYTHLHAGGLRYHGMSSTLSQLYHDGLMEAVAVEQTSVFEAAEQFARVEGILPAPESSHAIKVAIDEAMKCRETGEEKTIVFGLTGTGYFDMVAYEKFHNHEMKDYIPTDEDLKAGFDGIPRFPGNEF